MFRTIMIGVALDPRDAFLIETCASVAGPLGAQRIVLAHVRRHDRLPTELMGELEPHPGVDAHARLHELADNLRARLPGVEVMDVYAVGNPAEQILEIVEVEDADLLLLGRFGGTASHVDQGVEGRDILRHAACTTLLVPEGAATGLGHAVVGVDFSRCSTDALVVAAGLYRRVTPVFGYEIGPGISYGGLTHEASAAKLEQSVRDHFRDDVLPHLPAGAQVDDLRVIESEKASEAIMLVAAEAGADAIAMGSHGRTRLAALLLGSTAERIATRSSVPVLIVRDKAERLGLLGSLIHR